MIDLNSAQVNPKWLSIGAVALIFNIFGIIVSSVVGVLQLFAEEPSGHEWEDGTVVDPPTGMTAKEERNRRNRRKKLFVRGLFVGMLFLLTGTVLQLISLFK